MSRAAELLAQYQTKIAKVGQWIAIRRYSGTGAARTFADTLTRAYVRYYGQKELIGTVMQGDLVAIALVDTLGELLASPQGINTNDRLVTGFHGCDNPNETPDVDTGGHVNGRETAIKSVLKRTPGGTLIALELHAVG